MKFEHALQAMKQGQKVKLPSWGGYGEYNPQTDGIVMHTKDGEVLNNCTQRLLYTIENVLSDEWVIADDANTPILGGEATFSFGEAIKYLKRGLKVSRKGWNGKGMYLWLLPEAQIKKEWCRDERLLECFGESDTLLALGSIRMYTHDSTGRTAVLTGWLASQSDMLSEDWVIVE